MKIMELRLDSLERLNQRFEMVKEKKSELKRQIDKRLCKLKNRDKKGKTKSRALEKLEHTIKCAHAHTYT